MAIWPFNRKKNVESNVPKEVQEYYQAEKRERMGLAWLIAFLTLVITVLIVMGLFFGGRWVYRKVRDPNQPATTQTAPTRDTKSNQGADTNSQDNRDDNQQGQDSSDADANSQPTTTPTTGPSSLLNTGPTSDD